EYKTGRQPDEVQLGTLHFKISSKMGSWVDIPPSSDFSLANIPFGIISTLDEPGQHVAVAIGSYALDLKVLADNINLPKVFPSLANHPRVFAQPTLNAFARLGRAVHREV